MRESVARADDDDIGQTLHPVDLREELRHDGRFNVRGDAGAAGAVGEDAVAGDGGRGPVDVERARDVGAVQGIADLITRPGLINVDFADVRTVMSEMGMAMMGTATASGEERGKVEKMGEKFDAMLKTQGDLVKKYPSSPLRLDAEQAKRGEIDAIAIAAVDKDGGAWTITPPGDRFTHLIGALSVLQYKLLSRHCG